MNLDQMTLDQTKLDETGLDQTGLDHIKVVMISRAELRAVSSNVVQAGLDQTSSVRSIFTRPVWMIALLVVTLLGACGGKILPTHYYVLELPSAPMASADSLPFVAVVMPFKASQMLTQDRIVYRPAEGQVGFYEYHRWAEDPRETITSTMVSHLRSRKTFGTVLTFDGRSKADYIVQGRIEKMEEVDRAGAVSVHVRLSAELVTMEDGRPLWQGTAEAQGQVSTGEVSAVVTEMSRATQTSLNKLVADLDQFVRSNLPATAAQN